MATNEEMLVSAFQEKDVIRSTFNFGKYVQLCQPMTFLEILCFLCCFHVSKFKDKKIGRGVGGCCLANPSFSRIFVFFLTWQDP